MLLKETIKSTNNWDHSLKKTLNKIFLINTVLLILTLKKARFIAQPNVMKDCVI